MIKVDISEAELWKKFGSGDVKAFSVIYDHYADEMFRYGMKIAGSKEIVLDSIHDVFVKIFGSLRHDADIRNPKAYLLKALRGQIYDNIKRERKLLTVGIDGLPFEVEWKLSETAVTASMTARQKEAVYLHYSMGLSYEETAVLMDMNIQSLRNLLSRAVLKIRKIMPLVVFLQYFL